MLRFRVKLLWIFMEAVFVQEIRKYFIIMTTSADTDLVELVQELADLYIAYFIQTENKSFMT